MVILLISVAAAALAYEVPGRIGVMLDQRQAEEMELRILAAEEALSNGRISEAEADFSNALGSRLMDRPISSARAELYAATLRASAGYLQALIETGKLDEAIKVADAAANVLSISASDDPQLAGDPFLTRFLLARLRLQLFRGQNQSALATASQADAAARLAIRYNPYAIDAKWEQLQAQVLHGDLLGQAKQINDRFRLVRPACETVNTIAIKAFDRPGRMLLGARCIVEEVLFGQDLERTRAQPTYEDDRLQRLGTRASDLAAHAATLTGATSMGRAWAEASAAITTAQTAALLNKPGAEFNRYARETMARYQDVVRDGTYALQNLPAFEDSVSIAMRRTPDKAEREASRTAYETFRAAASASRMSPALARAAGLHALFATGLVDMQLDQAGALPVLEDVGVLLAAAELLEVEPVEPHATFTDLPVARVQARIRAGLALRVAHDEAAALAQFKRAEATARAHLAQFGFDVFARRAGLIASLERSRSHRALGQIAEADERLRHALHWGVHYGLDDAQRLAEAGSSDWAAEVKKARIGLPTAYTFPSHAEGQRQLPATVYAFDWPTDYPFAGADDQAELLRRTAGMRIAKDVLESYRKLQTIARENDVTFSSLAEYALTQPPQPS
jgi:hypothetical protein